MHGGGLLLLSSAVAGELIERVTAQGSITERQAAGGKPVAMALVSFCFMVLQSFGKPFAVDGAHVRRALQSIALGCVRDMLRAINYLHMPAPECGNLGKRCSN